MKPVDLQAALDANDAEGCIALFATATEAERRALAKTAAARLRGVTSDLPGHFMPMLDSVPDEFLHQFYPSFASNRGGLRAARVAVLATATLAELKKFAGRCLPSVEDAIAVLSARRPPWVGEWVEAILSWQGSGQWTLVRRMVREGLCDRPRSPQYIHAMIGAVYQLGLSRGVRAVLLDDPGLLEDEIWEIFQTEPEPGRLNLIPIDTATPPQARWELALAALAEDGRISRTRLLDASLDGLGRDFHEVRARWFALMHEALRPSVDERVERAGRYLGLVASRTRTTVTFALEALAELEKAGRLDPRSLVESVGPALLARAKGTVLAALGLIDRVARRDPEMRPRAAIVAVDALVHESPAVHQAALDLIERHGDRSDPTLAELLRARVETVAPSQRGRIASWLGPEIAPVAPEASDAGLDELLARAESIDPRLADRTGVTAAVEVLKQGGGEVPVVDFSEMDAPRLDPERAIVPIEDLDELIALFSALLENPEDPDDLERVLDGVSRLCDRRPDDFAVRTGPLRSRAERRREEVFSHLVPTLCDLAISWAGAAMHQSSRAYANIGLVGVFARRVGAIAGRAAEQRVAPLLGAPTHRGGWIDPRTLVERVKIWESRSLPLEPIDGSLGLLRLAPDPGPRAEALRSAAGLEGEYAAALRHALGGERETVGPDASLWVAAARARAPRDDDPLVEARHPGLGPDAGRAARCRLRPGPHPAHDRYRWSRYALIAHEPDLPPGDRTDLPTVLLHDVRSHWPLDDTRWLATIWPLGRDAFFAIGAEWRLGPDCTPTEVRYHRTYLEALLDPDVPIREMARLLLVGGLSSARPELQGLATDALIAAIDDGRIDGLLLGEALQRLLAEGLVKRARLARALGDAARVSELHALAVAQALQLALLAPDPSTRDLHLFLERLKELLIETGERTSVPGIEEHLRGLKVSGKTAALAREILALEPVSKPSLLSASIARALTSRLERAERWKRLGHPNGGRS